MANGGMNVRQDSKNFLLRGFKAAPLATVATICVIACVYMFFDNRAMRAEIKEAADKQAEREERRSDKTVDLVLKILRPDLQEIKENVQDAKENTDTVKSNAISKNKRK